MNRDGERVRVLVVDDHQAIADTLATILQRSGYEATAASSGEKALEADMAANADVLITDVLMGDMSGTDVAVCILKNRPACKIILFSGQAATLDLLQDSGLQGYQFEILAKPVPPMVLLDRLAAWRAQTAFNVTGDIQNF